MTVDADLYSIIVYFGFIYLAASCLFLTYYIIKDGLGKTEEPEETLWEVEHKVGSTEDLHHRPPRE